MIFTASFDVTLLRGEPEIKAPPNPKTGIRKLVLPTVLYSNDVNCFKYQNS